MGCCGSKENDGIVSQTAGVATAAGGAVVGAAGAVVGGTVAVARGGVALVPGGRNLLEHVDDATGAFADATVKTGELVAEATKKVASQADFMKIISSPEVQAKLPKIGVLRCARAKFMPAQLSVGSNSYLYTTVQAEVQGLPYSDVRAGKPLDAAQTKALKAAIDKLDSLGVVAITGDCGAFVHYQVEARKMTATPMVLSPLMQAPMLAAMYAETRLEHSGRPHNHRLTHRSSRYCRYMAEEKILVITNDSRDYSQANLEENLMKIGLSKEDAERFVILGLEKIEGFQVRGRAILLRNSAQFGAIRRNSAQFSDAASASTRPRTSRRSTARSGSNVRERCPALPLLSTCASLYRSTARSGAMRWTSRPPARRSSRRWRRRRRRSRCSARSCSSRPSCRTLPTRCARRGRCRCSTRSRSPTTSACRAPTTHGSAPPSARRTPSTAGRVRDPPPPQL